jgi:hypothetical protein
MLLARLSIALLAASLLAGCGKKEQASPAGPANTVTPAVATPAATPSPAAPARPAEIKSHKDGLEFTYAWPAAAAGIPELDRWLRGNAESLRGKTAKAAADDQASAKKEGYPFHDHSYEEKFAVVADIPRLLVLQSDGYVYTGGAHGYPINTVIIWDKAARKRLATGALVDIAAFKRLANDRFCQELDRQREEKRGEPVKRGDPNQIGGFTTCVDMAKQVLLPVSKGGKALDTFRIVIGPYEAGPYAEGTYAIELPFDAKTIAAVKPDWKDAFAVN